MQRPPPGLCLWVDVHRVRDGDTIEVKARNSDRVWPIRLIDCWAPELHTAAGKDAQRYAEQLLDAAEQVMVWVPAPKEVINLLREIVSFDRVLGHLFLTDDLTLSEAMVRAGHATKHKLERGPA